MIQIKFWVKRKEGTQVHPERRYDFRRMTKIPAQENKEYYMFKLEDEKTLRSSSKETQKTQMEERSRNNWEIKALGS